MDPRPGAAHSWRATICPEDRARTRVLHKLTWPRLASSGRCRTPCEQAVATSAAWPDSLCGDMGGARIQRVLKGHRKPVQISLHHQACVSAAACGGCRAAVLPAGRAAARAGCAVLSQQVAHGTFLCQRFNRLRFLFFMTRQTCLRSWYAESSCSAPAISSRDVFVGISTRLCHMLVCAHDSGKCYAPCRWL